ncbi:MAG TPA: hypothetical protein DEQ06_03350 [Porphyromonadaceae bacterium]|nr:hypothetical protein [Porphyromonadaceae bacterium]
MQYKLVKIDYLSGPKCSIYSILDCNDMSKTFLDLFIDENINSFKSETIELISRLKTIGYKTGARLQYFKVHEGKPGDGVCALFDNEESNLRLYCIRYGMQLIIVGGGGHKPKTIRALQEDEKLKGENYFLRELSALITERIKEKEIKFSDDGLDFIGDLEFIIEEL